MLETKLIVRLHTQIYIYILVEYYGVTRSLSEIKLSQFSKI